MIFDRKPIIFFLLSKKKLKNVKNFYIFLLKILFLQIPFTNSLIAIQEPNSLSNPSVSLNCDNFCKQFSNGKSIGGLTEGNTWSTIDDALCSSLGSPTTSNNYSLTSLTPIKASGPLPQCQIPFVLTKELMTAVVINSGGIIPPNDQICTQLGKMADHCYYHNSQVETQCQAYNILNGDDYPKIAAAEQALIGLDINATAICGVACSFPNSPMVIACGVLATITAASEIGITMTQQSSTIGAAISQYQATVISVLGTGALVGGLATTGYGIKKATSARNAIDKVAEVADEAAEVADSAEKETQTTLENMKSKAKGLGSKIKNLGSKITAERTTSCASAAIFAALTGLRVNSIKNIAQTKQQACQQINSLFSKPVSQSNSPDPAPINPSSNSAATSYYNVGTSYSDLKGGTTKTLAQEAAALEPIISQCCPHGSSSACTTCLANNGISAPSTPSDGNLLNPGAFPNVPSLPINIPGSISSALENGAGSAIKSALPSKLGPIADALSTIASIAEKNPITGFIATTKLDTGTYKSERNLSSTSETNPFGNLAIAPTATLPVVANTAPNTLNFTGSPENNDIWHRSGSKTLFQIVTDRIKKMPNRITKLEPLVINDKD